MLVREIKVNKSGGLAKSEIDFFGGEYSFAEKLRKFGTGSPKLIYESGIPEFDLLIRGTVEIIDAEYVKISLNVIVQNLKEVPKFFQKEPFDGRFNYSVSLHPPEKDYPS